MDQRVGVAEHELGQALGQQVLPTPDGPTKMKLPIGRFGIFQAAARAADCLADGSIASF
jgi:hypothetical protein